MVAFATFKPSLAPPATDYPIKWAGAMDELDARFDTQADFGGDVTVAGTLEVTGTSLLTGNVTLQGDLSMSATDSASLGHTQINGSFNAGPGKFTGNVGVGVTAAVRLDVYGAALTSTTDHANVVARIGSNGSGADVTLQFTDSVTNNGFLSYKAGLFKTSTGLAVTGAVAASHLGVGGANSASRAIDIQNADLTGADQYGVFSAITISSAAIGSGQGCRSVVSTAAAAFTCPDLRLFTAQEGNKGAGSTITVLEGYRCNDLTVGATNYGFRGQVSAGANKFNAYMDGTANNYFAGNVYVGQSTPALGRMLESFSATSVAAAFVSAGAASAETVDVWHQATSGDNNFIEFATEAARTIRGTIDYNRASNATRYNTSSGGDLKFDDGPAPEVGDFIDSLEMRLVRWKDTGIGAITPIAENLHKVSPFSVSRGRGAPGDVDYRPWGWDGSTLIPYMIREIQSLRTRVAQLEGA